MDVPYSTRQTIRGWLECQPLLPMLLSGLVAGGGLGAWALWGLGGWLGGVVCLLLVGLATALAWGAEPVLKVAIDSPEAPSSTSAQAPQKPYVVDDIPVLLSMVELEGGTFWMGSEDTDEERPRHPVVLSDFAIMQIPVTRQLFRKVMGKQAHPEDWSTKSEDALRPANNVSWFDAVDFCNALSKMLGLTPCYDRNAEVVSWKLDADGYRLPTEAEWEYACRAGTDTRWFFGDDAEKLEYYAWFNKEWDEGPYPVAQKQPNPWQLYDMAGNVWEWCWDWYGPYSKESQENPLGPKQGEYHSLRGGSFYDPAEDLRAAYRVRLRPDDRFRRFGFRCVRAPRRQS